MKFFYLTRNLSCCYVVIEKILFLPEISAMELILRPIFNVLTVPDLKIKKPSWVQTPSPWTIFTFILLSYFLVTGGIIYDVIVEPPSVGSTTDEHGHQRPVAFMPYRVNGKKPNTDLIREEQNYQCYH